MRIGLLLNSNNKLNSYAEKYKDILDLNNIQYCLIDSNSPTIIEDIRACSHILFRHSQGDTDMLIYETIFHIAHNVLDVKCYPNYETYWPYENKVKEYYLLKSNGFPIIDSNPFWNYHHAFEYLRSAQYPLVAKLPKGAGSKNVVIVNSANEGEAIIKQVFRNGVKPHALRSKSNLASLSKAGVMFYSRAKLKSMLKSIGLLTDKREFPEWQIQKDSILFQTFMPDNKFDTRVTIIGDRALAFRRFVREDDFRASGSGSFDLSPEAIDQRCIEIAFGISKRLNFDTMAYDFIYDRDHRPVINEISYCFVDWVVEKCPGFWDDTLTWHEGHYWPQYFQVSDFLKLTNMKQIR